MIQHKPFGRSIGPESPRGPADAPADPDQQEALRRLGAFALQSLRHDPPDELASPAPSGAAAPDGTDPRPTARGTDPTRRATRTGAAARSATAPQPGWRRALYGGLGLVLLLGLYVLMRDAMTVAKGVTQALSDKAVLVCVDGRMAYGEADGPWARLTDQGRFVCTEWRQAKGWGMLTLR